MQPIVNAFRRAKDSSLSAFLLVIPIVISWSLYPWAISWLYPNLIRSIVGASFTLVFTLVMLFETRQTLQPNNHDKILAVLAGCYILIVLLASLIYNSGDRDLLLRYLLKFAFFFLLILYLNRSTIFLTADIYAYLCVALVIFSIAGVFSIAMGWVELQFIDVVLGINGTGKMIWSFSGFDGTARIFPDSNKFVRMQSFALEPGAFALALLPALFWLTLVRERYAPAVIIALGISASWSFGALLALILSAIVLLINWRVTGKVKIFILSTIVFFFVSHILFSWMVDLGVISSASINPTSQARIDLITGGEKTFSKQQRVDELLQVMAFVKEDFWGAGVGAGREVLDSSISVGYANVFADTGILGGTLYALMFSLFGLLALKIALGLDREISQRIEGKAAIAWSLSVLTCLFFGLQREQPDASYWHMWIYASFFVLVRMNRQSIDCSS